MVLDTSALIAYLNGEPEAERLKGALLQADSLFLSAASLVEAGIVAGGQKGEAGERRLDRLLRRLRVEIVPVTADHAEVARDAYRRFGKGNHPARLNFGDCFSYALAHALGRPLLFVGDDFSRTDVEVARY
jgi:ribonuclease VapC